MRNTSTGKQTWPGAKQVWCHADWSGDVLALADEPRPADETRPLLVAMMRNGHRTEHGDVPLERAADHFERTWTELPARLKHLTDPPAHEPQPSPRLVSRSPNSSTPPAPPPYDSEEADHDRPAAAP